MEIVELDCVVLVHDLPERRLKAGDVGTVVHVYPGGAAFEVEFVALDGHTLGVETLEARDVRLAARDEVATARALG